MKDIANFLFEAGILSKTPRSGFHFLGSGNQSVAEHLNRVSYIGYTLASLQRGVDMAKVLKMCMFHDFAESRVSDLNYVHQKYVESDEEAAIEDLTSSLPFGDDMKEIIEEYEERKSPEAILVKDADILELILSLKEQLDNGNSKAESWIESVMKRLVSPVAKRLAEEILNTHSDDWWFGDKKSDWGVNRNKETLVSYEEENEDLKEENEREILFPNPQIEKNLEEEKQNFSEDKENLSKREKEILTLMDDVPTDSYVEYVQRFTDYLRINIVNLVESFLKRGFLEKVVISQGDDERAWYFHTDKVLKEMLDSEMIYRRDFSTEY